MPLEEVVAKVLGQRTGLEKGIADLLVEREGTEGSLFELGSTYQPMLLHVGTALAPWARATDALKHRQRFFSEEILSLFNRLFADLEVMETPPIGLIDDTPSPVVHEITAGASIFRARRLSSETRSMEGIFDAAPTWLGAPPAHLASAGRMNAKGIPAFYGAGDPETCFAEMRPGIGERVVIGRYRAARHLRILNFTRFGLAESTLPLSYLDPEFATKAHDRLLLNQLHHQIARPVLPDRDHDYLITQALAEYLAFVRRPGFDGLMFNSVQRAEGVNIVLFRASDSSADEAVFPVEWSGEPPAVWETKDVRYESEAVRIGGQFGRYAIEPQKGTYEWYRQFDDQLEP
ncbi:RES family NAD+ phosphorylase [Variovorax sp. LjRoot175]|uniref:RES family NAD+ phosphorylase n=1 Tax=Variovorax sp. LjRoot175 TaxID=3342276 RepID=UPI003ECEF712